MNEESLCLSVEGLRKEIQKASAPLSPTLAEYANFEVEQLSAHAPASLARSPLNRRLAGCSTMKLNERQGERDRGRERAIEIKVLKEGER